MCGGVNMIPRIEMVKPLENYLLYVVFKDGKKGFYNVLEDIEQIPQFEDLKTINGLFKQVQVDESGTCVFWSDFIDLPSDAIYENLMIDDDYTKLTSSERARLEEAEADSKTIDRVLIRFVPEEEPTQEEIEAIAEAKADIEPTKSHNDINWD